MSACVAAEQWFCHHSNGRQEEASCTLKAREKQNKGEKKMKQECLVFSFYNCVVMVMYLDLSYERKHQTHSDIRDLPHCLPETVKWCLSAHHHTVQTSVTRWTSHSCRERRWLSLLTPGWTLNYSPLKTFLLWFSGNGQEALHTNKLFYSL